MLTRRIIPCLDVKDGRVVKGVKFQELRDAGDPVEAARAYGAAGADELCFLDISASLESRGTLVQLVERVALELAIPFAVGGGVRGVADAEALLRAGADKVSLNTAALAQPALFTEVAKIAGGQLFRATDTKSLEQIYQDIDKLEKSTVSVKKYQEYRELFPLCIMSGCGLLLGQILLAQTIWKKLP